MKNSTFHQPLEEELLPNMARAYRLVDGEYLEGDFEFLPEPAGGMSSTASDMTRFMIAYLQDGSFSNGRILEEETVRLMHSQQFTHHPILGGMAHGFMEGTFNEQRALFHGGSTMLFNTGLYLLPEKNVGIFISYSGGSYLAHIELFQEFMDHYYPSTYSQDHLPPEGTVERSSKYVGEYHQNRRSITTSEKFLSLLMGMVQIDMDEDGYLLVTHAGETNRFVEIEPGVYQNLREGRTQDYFGLFKTLVFEKDPFDRIMLMTDGPMTYSQVPWYSTSAFTIISLILALLFILGSLIYRSISSVIRYRRQKVQVSKGAIAARWATLVYSILTLGLVVGLLLSGKLDPVYQLPKSAFGMVPAWYSVFDLIPVFMALFGVVILIFAFIVWWRKYWWTLARIHYTLYATATLVLLWIFSYWNIV
jgi:hypothetical protein